MSQEINNEEFSDDYVPASNWFSFDEIGKTIKGTFMNKFFKEGKDGMPDQIVYELCNVSIKGEVIDPAEEWKVPTKASNKYLLDRLKTIKPGQRIGFMFEKEVPAVKKGHKPAKSIKPFVWGMDTNYEAMAIAEETGGKVIDGDDFPTEEAKFD